jgi:hypothetical protein
MKGCHWGLSQWHFNLKTPAGLMKRKKGHREHRRKTPCVLDFGIKCKKDASFKSLALFLLVPVRLCGPRSRFGLLVEMRKVPVLLLEFDTRPSSVHWGIRCSSSVVNYVTPWGIARLKKLTIAQLVKCPAFYGTRRFITVFSRARHWTLFCARRIQPACYHHITSK